MTELKDIQRIECLMLDEFARVCKENNLTWFADSGTLLGAIRHKGFIPWDDDVDVVMPRKDYNRLIELGNSIFKQPFFLQTHLTDKECSYNVQLRYTNSAKIRQFELSDFYRPEGKHFSSNKGIAMDICPIDHVPNNEKEITVISKAIKFCLHYCSQRLLTYMEYNKYLNVDDYTHAMIFLNNTLTKIDEVNKQSGIMACTTWWGINQYTGCRVNSSCYDSSIEADFDGCKEKVSLPVGWHEILTAYYGDYMKEKKGGSLHEIVKKDVLFDVNHSYIEYEKLTNDEILALMKANKTI